MDQERAIEAFASLAQETRLKIFRLLVSEEPHGLRVGEISRRLGIVPSTLSGHLAVLKRAGLLKSTRQQREIYYTANLKTMGLLIKFMLENCCQGQVDNCGEIVALLKRA